MITVVTAAGVLAEFVIGSLVLVPMSAGGRGKPVEGLVAGGASTDRFEPCESLHEPHGEVPGPFGGHADPAGASRGISTGASQGLPICPERGARPPRAAAALTDALRPSAGTNASRAQVAP